MVKYERRGHSDVEDTDGGPLLIVYINEDDKRTAKVIEAEVEVLRAFAAAYTRGEPDDKGLLPARNCRPCEVICEYAYFSF
ncbi:hypothetical protein F5883DRAFT_638044 [Diaporthe sp. PMI_573]|nr:hypothetical protein F5883DRAFT_638044 [Diaporthaceae sp. PMI_573]